MFYSITFLPLHSSWWHIPTFMIQKPLAHQLFFIPMCCAKDWFCSKLYLLLCTVHHLLNLIQYVSQNAAKKSKFCFLDFHIGNDIKSQMKSKKTISIQKCWNWSWFFKCKFYIQIAVTFTLIQYKYPKYRCLQIKHFTHANSISCTLIIKNNYCWILTKEKIKYPYFDLDQYLKNAFS